MSLQTKEVELALEVGLVEDEKAIYVKITGFETVEDADEYGEFLAENLPLLLFNSEVKH
jgi:hypothetical protein